MASYRGTWPCRQRGRDRLGAKTAIEGFLNTA
ncbi:hypothetical protein BKA01_000378 [Pseudonocardia eucalypti]|nr:hypothetical protein [Pseudonocardia eucalypti]